MNGEEENDLGVGSNRRPRSSTLEDARRESTEDDPLLGTASPRSATGPSSFRNRAFSDADNNSVGSGITLQSGTTMQSGTTLHSRTSFVSTIAETVETLLENATEMVEEITENFIEELVDAGDQNHPDRHYFLDMNLTRSLSLTPGDIVEASNYVTMSTMPLPDPDAYEDEDEESSGLHHLPTIEEYKRYEEDNIITKEEEDNIKKEVEQEGIPISAYFLLCSAVVSLSAIGPFLNLQKNVSATMKILWRTLATSLILFPFAVVSIRRDGFPQLSLIQWALLITTAALYASMCVLFVWALELTAVGNAVIFSNSQSLLLLAGKMFVGQHVTRLEGTGALIAFSGAILCSKDSADTAHSEASTSVLSTFMGDFYAIASALAGVAYLVLAKTVRPMMDLYVFMFFIMFVSAVETLICVRIRGEHVSWDMDSSHGVFGWLTLLGDRLPLELLMAVICNLFGAMGYVRAMHYFDNLVISVATLMEPVVAELLASAIGVGVLPHLAGWIGNLLVLLGTFGVVYKPAGTAQSQDNFH